MLKQLINYFLPMEREGKHWRYRYDLLEPNVHTYLLRTGIPTFLFWSLDLAFIQAQPVLAAVCLGITLPFSYLFGLVLRVYLDTRKSH